MEILNSYIMLSGLCALHDEQRFVEVFKVPLTPDFVVQLGVNLTLHILSYALRQNDI